MNRIAKVCTRNIVCVVLLCLATFPVRLFSIQFTCMHFSGGIKEKKKKEHRIGLKEC